MISLYMDEHVARAITEGLRLRGVDVLTVQEDGRRGISDAAVLDRATELGRPLVATAARPEEFRNRVEYLPL